MFAFWRKIRLRDNIDGANVVVGAARTLPETPPWSMQLRKPFHTPDSISADATTEALAPSAVEALSLDHIYVSTSNGRPWTRSMGMPNYEEIFQGF